MDIVIYYRKERQRGTQRDVPGEMAGKDQVISPQSLGNNNHNNHKKLNFGFSSRDAAWSCLPWRHGSGGVTVHISITNCASLELSWKEQPEEQKLTNLQIPRSESPYGFGLDPDSAIASGCNLLEPVIATTLYAARTMNIHGHKTHLQVSRIGTPEITCSLYNCTRAEDQRHRASSH